MDLVLGADLRPAGDRRVRHHARRAADLYRAIDHDVRPDIAVRVKLRARIDNRGRMDHSVGPLFRLILIVVVAFFFLRQLLARNAVAPFRPRAEVDQAAALGAERPGRAALPAGPGSTGGASNQGVHAISLNDFSSEA